jgi:chromosome segregation ATPase
MPLFDKSVDLKLEDEEAQLISDLHLTNETAEYKYQLIYEFSNYFKNSNSNNAIGAGKYPMIAQYLRKVAIGRMLTLIESSKPLNQGPARSAKPNQGSNQPPKQPVAQKEGTEDTPLISLASALPHFSTDIPDAEEIAVAAVAAIEDVSPPDSRNKFDELQQAFADAQRRIVDAQRRIAELEGQLANRPIEEKVDSLEHAARIAELEGERNAARQNSEARQAELAARIAELTNQLAAAQRERDAAVAAGAAAKATYDVAQAQAKGTEDERLRIGLQIRELERQVEERNRELEAAQKDKTDIQAQSTQKNANMAQLRTDREAADVRVQAAEAAAKTAQDRLAETSAQLGEAQGRAQTAVSDAAAAAAAAEAANQLLQEKDASHASIQGQLERVQGELQEAQRQLQEAQDRISTAQQERNDISAARTKNQGQHQADIAAAKDEAAAALAKQQAEHAKIEAEQTAVQKQNEATVELVGSALMAFFLLCRAGFKDIDEGVKYYKSQTSEQRVDIATISNLEIGREMMDRYLTNIEKNGGEEEIVKKFTKNLDGNTESPDTKTVLELCQNLISPDDIELLKAGSKNLYRDMWQSTIEETFKQSGIEEGKAKAMAGFICKQENVENFFSKGNALTADQVKDLEEITGFSSQKEKMLDTVGKSLTQKIKSQLDSKLTEAKNGFTESKKQYDKKINEANQTIEKTESNIFLDFAIPKFNEN